MQNVNKIVRTLVLTLSFLILITSSMVGRMLAKFASTGEGTDSARVASFHIEMKAEDSASGGLHYSNDYVETGTTDIQTNDSYGFQVVGSTEVQMKYGFSVKMTHADGTALTDNQWKELVPTILLSSTQEALPFGAIQISEDGVSCEHVMKSSDWIAMPPTDSYEQGYTLSVTDGKDLISDEILIEILIEAEQVD